MTATSTFSYLRSLRVRLIIFLGRPISLTTPADEETFVPQVLTTQLVDKLANAIYCIEGDRKTVRGLIATWENKHGCTTNIMFRSPAEHEAYRAKLGAVIPLDFMFSNIFEETF